MDHSFSPSVREVAAASGQVFGDPTQWQAALKGCGITKERHVRVATEGALLGSLLDHDFNRDLAIVSDDAGQFNVLLHFALCWIHAERLLTKLIGFTDSQRQALEQVRSEVWQYYRDLKAYQLEPTPAAKLALEGRFDTLCTTHTCSTSLNLALKRMLLNKRGLLLVLERPNLPLHNNLSEGDIREYVKRRKICGGTRSDAGRRCRDTFASSKMTCRKLGISFWRYLNDRLRSGNVIPALLTLIEARAQVPLVPVVTYAPKCLMGAHPILSALVISHVGHVRSYGVGWPAAVNGVPWLRTPEIPNRLGESDPPIALPQVTEKLPNPTRRSCYWALSATAAGSGGGAIVMARRESDCDCTSCSFGGRANAQAHQQSIDVTSQLWLTYSRPVAVVLNDLDGL